MIMNHALNIEKLSHENNQRRIVWAIISFLEMESLNGAIPAKEK
jgi:hypothetical protein